MRAGGGPEVKVRPSIEPSEGGGEGWACRGPIEVGPGPFDCQNPMPLCAASCGGRDLFVLALNRGGTSETEVDNVIIVCVGVCVFWGFFCFLVLYPVRVAPALN